MHFFPSRGLATPIGWHSLASISTLKMDSLPPILKPSGSIPNLAPPLLEIIKGNVSGGLNDVSEAIVAEHMGSYGTINGQVMKGSKKLSDFVKLDLLEREDPVRILEIWMEYFSKKEGEVAGVLSDAEYDILSFRTNKSPLSILPVKAGEGYKVVAAQTSSDKAMVTNLDEFKKNPAAAEPIMVVSLHKELLKEKGIVLVGCYFSQTDLDKDSARKLLLDLFFAYCDTKTFNEVNKLNHQPNTFEWDPFLKFFLDR